MWRPFKQRSNTWSLSAFNDSAPKSASDAAKHGHEFRLLDLLLPTILDERPIAITKRESPDFEVTTRAGSLFFEAVDAVPDGVSGSSTMNLAKRRSRPNPNSYRVDAAQFGKVIAREIDAKRQKATRWLHAEPQLAGRMVLLVNGGQGPLRLRHYFTDVETLGGLVRVTAIDPFQVVALGDETGAFIWGDVP